MPVSFPANRRCGWFPAADPGFVSARRRERRREVSVFPQPPSLSLPRQRSVTSKPSSLSPSRCHGERRLTGGMSTRTDGLDRWRMCCRKAAARLEKLCYCDKSFVHFHFHAVSSSLLSFKIHTNTARVRANGVSIQFYLQTIAITGNSGAKHGHRGAALEGAPKQRCKNQFLVSIVCI